MRNARPYTFSAAGVHHSMAWGINIKKALCRGGIGRLPVAVSANLGMVVDAKTKIIP